MIQESSHLSTDYYYNEPIPNFDITLKNRDKQLCKPLVRLFQGTESVEEIKQSLSKLLKEKKERKAVTIEAILYDAVDSLAKKEAKAKEKEGQKSLDKSVILDFAPIWIEFVNKIGGEISPKHPKTVETSEYGPITQPTISSILRDRFGGEDARDNKTRKLRFSLSKLEKLGANYSRVDNIEIIEKPTKKTKTAGDAGDVGDPAMKDDMKKTLEKDAGKEHVKESPPPTPESPESQNNHTQGSQPAINERSNGPTEKPISHDLPMPEEHEDGLPVVTEKELESSIQEPHPSKPITPDEVCQFFNNDIPLDSHSLAESPCAAIIGSKPGEIPTDTVYHCKLCPDMIPSTFLQAVENHCRDKEPDVHKAEILRIIGGE